MRLWIDTEFNGFGGQLLSIALVGESHTFYREVGCGELVSGGVYECCE